MPDEENLSVILDRVAWELALLSNELEIEAERLKRSLEKNSKISLLPLL
jgi:hypothetical protein